MKKIQYNVLCLLVIFSFLATSPLLFSQQLPNGGFETFKSNAYAGYEPTGWVGSNVSQMGVDGIFITEDGGGRTGKCVRMENKWVGALGIGSNAPAYISLGTPWSYINGTNLSSASGGTDGGLDFKFHPDTLVLWVKRPSSTGETAHALIYLWAGTAYGDQYKNTGGGCSTTSHTNEESDIRGTNTCRTTQSVTLIGQGEWKSSATISNWTRIAVPVTYNSNADNTVPEKMNVIISSADYPNGRDASKVLAGSTLYADDAKLAYSSQLGGIKVNGNSLKLFNKDLTTQSFSLGLGVTEMPTITCFRSGRQIKGSEVNIQYGTVDGSPTLITVNAEDGSSSTTYTLYFVSAKSTNARPASILVNGVPVKNFNGYINQYNIDLPYGTSNCPTIEVEKADEKQTFTISECSTVPGKIIVTVKAEDTSVSETYTLNFSIAQLSDNTLSDILINGVSLPGYTPSRTNYTVDLPVGTTTVPTITPVSKPEYGTLQTISATDNGLNGTYEVAVSTPGNTTPRVYKLTFRITASTYALLQGISIGGTPINKFTPETVIYNYELPQGTTSIPEITWTKGDPYQTVTMIDGGTNGDTKIMVQAQSGNTTTYRIRFSVFKSSNVQLTDIRLNGTSINGFEPEVLVYKQELPSGTTTLPSIEYTQGDPAQTVRIVTNGVNGSTTLRVAAEDGINVRIYQINFSVTKSTDAELNNLFINGIGITGFDPKTFEYTYILDDGATACPTITVEPQNENQTIEITTPKTQGTASIKVYSEGGDSYNIYSIKITYKQSDNCNLKGILLNGSVISGFDENTQDYTINLLTETMPNISYIQSDSTQNVVVIDGGFSEGYTLVVTAQNGVQKNYSVKFNLAPSGNSLLKDIQLFNKKTAAFESIKEFAPNTFAYTDTLEWRTMDIPTINPIAGQKGQIITISYGKTNAETIIHVVAENGTSQDYTINFPVRKSSICTLNSIMLDGEEIQGFSPNSYTYNIKLPYGTTKIPSVTYQKGLDINGNPIYEQHINATITDLNSKSTIKVIAENGDSKTYELTFAIDMKEWEGKNKLTMIEVGGVGVNGFSPENFVYNVTLPYGTTEIPEIKYIKNYEEQTVAITKGSVHSATTITVKSNIEGTDDQTYTLNFKVNKLNDSYLTGIYADGNLIPNFNPEITKYVIQVDALPEFTTTKNNGVLVSATTNSNIATFSVSNERNSDETEYTVYIHYNNDVIPNASFEDWSGTKYNGAQKPTGWTVPADIVEKYQFAFFGTYTSGAESTPTNVNQVPNDAFTLGEKVALLKTTYHRWSLSGSVPGMMTLGSMAVSLTSGGGSTSSVGNGIPFRNTPDTATMSYRPESSSNISRMHYLYTLSNSEASIKKEYYGNYSNLGNWVSMKLPLYDATVSSPSLLNITINSGDQEDANNYGGVTAYESSLYVDKLGFIYNSTIAELKINGTAIASINKNMSHTIDADFEGIPSIDITGEVSDQMHLINIGNETAVGSDMARIATIKSIAEDGTSTNYTLTVTRPKSTVKTLKGVFVNGAAVEGFNPDNKNYSVIVPNGTNRVQDIQVQKGNEHQAVAYQISDKNDTIFIHITAENGDKNTYTIAFTETKSSDATLKDLLVEGRDIVFVPTVDNYTETLETEATSIPTITFEKNTIGQTVKIDEGGVNGDTKITVLAEDGISTKTYAITFSTLKLDTTALLKKIEIDGIGIEGFDSYTYEYRHAKSSEEMAVYYEKMFIQDSLATILYSDSIVWKVINEKETAAYKLLFDKTVSADANLTGIIVNGTALDGFRKDSLHYSVTINADTIPKIEIQKGSQGQNITISENVVNGNSTIEITVVAENGINTQDYTVEIILPKSSNAELSDITLDGIRLNGFKPDSFNYAVELPFGTKTMPFIATMAGNDNQTISITNGGVKGTSTIVVTAEDGISKNDYTITFTVKKSDNALLKNILIDAQPIAGFAATQLEYGIELPVGTKTLPEITPVKGDEWQTLNIENNGVNGDYKILVTSEDLIQSNNYTIHFSVKKSDNTKLDSLLENGKLIKNFDADIIHYSVTVPYGTTNVPTITFVKREENQNVTINPAASLSDTTFVHVIAENGTATLIYKVSFNILLSSESGLKMIYIGGDSLLVSSTKFTADRDFDKDADSYEISLPYGTTTLPNITWDKIVPDYESITLKFDTTSVITVISQDKTNEFSYRINFKIEKTDKLKSVSYFGIPIKNFHSDTLVYHLTFPYGTSIDKIPLAENISYVKKEAYQIVSVNQKEKSERKSVVNITVTAGEGGSSTTYTIISTIDLSDYSLLKDIKIKGKSIDGFNPNVFQYTYVLPYGTSVIPTDSIESIKGMSIQETEHSILGNTINIKVWSQKDDLKNNPLKDPSHIYSIKFVFSTENPGDAPTPDDVCWMALGNGEWKASSSRNNVSIYIFDTAGRLIKQEKIPAIDPNDDLCSTSSDGVRFRFERQGKVYIYLFAYNKKKIISNKILY